METVSIQRDQVKVTGEFAQSMSAVSASMMAGARPEDITKVQMELESALTRAQTLDETLAAVMDASNDTIFSSEGLSDSSLKEIFDVFTSGKKGSKISDITEQIEMMMVFSIHFYYRYTTIFCLGKLKQQKDISHQLPSEINDFRLN